MGAIGPTKPGKLTDHAFIAAFSGRFRARCPDAHWFLTGADASEKLEAWRNSCNAVRPFFALGSKPRIGFMSPL